MNGLVAVTFVAAWVLPLAFTWGAGLGWLPGLVRRPPAVLSVLGLAATSGLAYVAWRLPPGWFALRGAERSGRLYERLGVRRFRAVVSDGDLERRWRRRRDGDWKAIHTRRDAARWIAIGRHAERTHLAHLAIGVCTAAYAAMAGLAGMAAYLCGANVIGNLYPALLQRYTRARIERLKLSS